MGFLTDMETIESMLLYQVVADITECQFVSGISREVADRASDILVGTQPKHLLFRNYRRNSPTLGRPLERGRTTLSITSLLDPSDPTPNTLAAVAGA